MGLFKKDICSVCGAEVGLLSGMFLGDESRLCKMCSKIVDSNYIDYAQKKWNMMDYKEFIRFKSQQNVRKQLFERTLSYGKFHVDEQHNLFVLADSYVFDKFGKLNESVDVFDIFDFEYVFDDNKDKVKIKEGLVNDYIVTDVVLKYKITFPKIEGTITVKPNVKVKIETTGIMKKKINYILPKDYVEFVNKFTAYICTLKLIKAASYEELVKAKSLLMLDDEIELTQEVLDDKRQKMYEIYKDDMVSIRKIDDAYDVLCVKLKSSNR